VVICLEPGADLHMAQLMPLPLTVSCFRKIQIGFTLLVPADPGSPGKRDVKWVCVCPLGTLQKWLNRSQAGSGTDSPGPKGQRVPLWSRSHTGRSTFGAGSSGCGKVDDWR